MIMAKPDWMRDLDQDQIDFLQGLSAAAAVCRGKRRHKFPGLVPGQDSEDISVTRVHGIYQVTETCERGCGRTISYEAGTDGIPDYSTARYGGWKIGSQLARGLGLTVVDDFEYMRWLQREAVIDAFRLRSRERQQDRRATLQRIGQARREAAGAVEKVPS